MRRVAALLAVVLVGLATPVVASAAQLDLAGPALVSATTAQRCDDAVTTTTSAATSTTVTVSGIAASCAGLPVTVRVHSTSPAAASAPVTVPTGGGSVTATVRSYTPTAAHKTYVTIGGWPVSSTWSYSPPTPSNTCIALRADGSPQPGGTCVITGITMASPWGTPRQTNGHISVTSSSPYLSFSVDLRPSLPAGWNWSTSGTRSPNAGHTTTPGSRCSALPSYGGTTNPGWATVDIYLEVFENRSGISGLNCVP